jgi:predicted nucleic acid-binding protein
MPRIYLDTSPVIYTVQRVAPFAAQVDAKLADPATFRVSSDLTWMECRVKPLRNSDPALLQDFEDFFTGTVNEMISLSRDVLEKAASIRATYGFKTPDAIQLAAALSAHCDVFLTNDHSLAKFSGITIEVI